VVDGPLRDLRCVPCRRDTPPLGDAEVAALLPQIPEWQLVESNGVKKLRRAFRFSDFAQALDFASGVGDVAEDQGHHPVLLIEWGRATVTWWTHAIRGLHRNDFVMAAKTDELFERP